MFHFHFDFWRLFRWKFNDFYWKIYTRSYLNMPKEQMVLQVLNSLTAAYISFKGLRNFLCVLLCVLLLTPFGCIYFSVTLLLKSCLAEHFLCKTNVFSFLYPIYICCSYINVRMYDPLTFTNTNFAIHIILNRLFQAVEWRNK